LIWPAAGISAPELWSAGAGGGSAAVDDALLENVAKPIARRFGVSPAEIPIWLERQGLLLRQAPRQTSLMVGP
jgi:hypothetical protein